jgi:hypothetical protein
MCIEKQTLEAAFLNAIRDMQALLSEQGRALAEDETGLDRFETALTLARERRDNAQLALLAHIRTHGC